MEINMKDTFSTYHPLLNLLYFIGTIGVTVFVTHPVLLGISFVTSLLYSGVLRGFAKTIKFNLVFALPSMVIVALINPMFNHYGVTTLGYLSNGNPFTLESCVYGLVMAVMLACTLIWFACYTEVMTTDKFIYLFGRVIPSLSLVLSMCLRFVPMFVRQLSVISDGQKCVGRSASNGSVIKRVKHGITIFSILVTWALENAIETADSMKSRGYGLPGRSAFSIYQFNRRDKILGTAMLALTGISVYGCSKGAAFAQYNPRILLAGFTVFGRTPSQACSPLLAGITFVSFGLFCFLPLILDLAEEYAMDKSRSHAQTDMLVTYQKIYEELAGDTIEGEVGQ